MRPPVLSRPPFPRLFGDYALLAPLADARADGVYLATNRKLAGEGRACVLKLRRLPPGRVLDLEPPPVPVVSDLGVVRDQAFVAMPLVEGRDVFEVWNRCASLRLALPVPIAMRILGDALAALAPAHASGTAYRQLCPSKILISGDGDVQLAEASLRLNAHPPPSGCIPGRTGYVAPEVLAGSHATTHGDVYAAGVILWELLTGRTLAGSSFAPRSGGPPTPSLQRMRGEARREIAPPSKVHSRAPTVLDGPVLKALAVDPRDRYPGASSFLAAVDGTGAAQAGREDVAGLLASLFGAELTEDRRRVRSLVQQGYLLLGSPPRPVPRAPASARMASHRPDFPVNALEQPETPAALGPPSAAARRRSPSLGVEPVRGVPPPSSTQAPPATSTRGRAPLIVGLGAAALLGTAAIGVMVPRRPLVEPSETSATPKTAPSVSTATPAPPAPVAPPPPPKQPALTAASPPPRPLAPSSAEPLTGTHDVSRVAVGRPSRADRARASTILREAQDAYDRSNFPLAVTLANRAAAASAGAEAYAILGDARLALSRYREAAEAYRKALKLDRHLASAKMGLQKAQAGLDESR